MKGVVKVRVRQATRDDIDTILAIAVRNRNVKLSESETFVAKAKRSLNSFNVLEDSLGNVVGYSKIKRQNGRKVTIEAIGIKAGCRDKGYETNLFEPIKAKYNIIEYNGRYSKALGFKNGSYSRKVTNSTMCNNKEKLKTRHETLDGIEYLVAPVVMVKEQVLNGELLPRDEIAKSTVGWNGRPVVVYHPKDKDGEDTIANDPEIIPNYEVGRIYNAEYEEETTKLKAEIWIDISKAKRKNKDTREALRMIQNSDELEVSTGYIVNDREEVSGTFDGVDYVAIQREILPDHLALLPKEIGACSWEDGAGVRNNSNKGIVHKIKSFLFGNAQVSLQGAIQAALREQDENVQWVNDMVYDSESGTNYAIYSVRTFNDEGEEVWPSQIFKVDYSVDEEGRVIIGDAPIEVEPITEYKPKINSNKEDSEVKKDALVQAVIANSKGKFGRKDRNTLMNMAENVLVSMLPKDKQAAFNKTAEPAKKEKGITSNAKANDVIANILGGKKVKVNEGEDVVIQDLLTMPVEDVPASLEGLAPEELEAVATALDEAIVVIETVATVADTEVANALTTVVDSADAVLMAVEDAIDAAPAEGEEEPAENAGEEEEEMDKEKEEEEKVNTSEPKTHRRERSTEAKPATNASKKTTQTQNLDEYINNIPDASAREFIINGINQAKKQRATLLGALTKNKACKFTKEELNAMTTNQLEKIQELVGGTTAQATFTGTNYGIFGVQQMAANSQEDDDEIPLSVNIFEGGK